MMAGKKMKDHACQVHCVDEDVAIVAQEVIWWVVILCGRQHTGGDDRMGMQLSRCRGVRGRAAK